MSITHHMNLRARHGRAAQLGQCLLAGLEPMCGGAFGCTALSIHQARDEPACWQVRSNWRSVAARDAFLAGQTLRQVLASALGQDLLASLDCSDEPRRQVA